MTRESEKNENVFNTFFFLFILLLSVYHFDFWSNSNTMSRVIFVKSVVDDNTLNVDKYHETTNDIAFVNGHYYSEKAPLPALLTMPLYYLLKLAGRPAGDHLAYTVGNLLTGSLPFTLIVFFTFLFLQRIKPSPENVLLSTLPFFGSFIFIYSGTFFAHAMTAMLILLAYRSLKYKENYFLSGLLAGLAVLCEYPVIIIISIWFLQIIIRKKKIKPALQFITGGLPSGLFLLYYNYILTGSPLDSLYNHLPNFPESNSNLGFRLPYPEAILQLSVGIYRGILFFAPALIALLFYRIRNKATNKNSILTNYLWLPTVLYFFAICSNFTWRGGWCYGPRYLSCIAVLFLFEGVIFLKNHSSSFKLIYFISTIGVLFSFLAKSTLVYSLPSDIKNPVVDLIIPEFLKGNFNANNLLTIWFNWGTMIANIAWLILLSGGLFFLYRWKKKITPSPVG